jgi:hypothetical protein
MSITVGPRREVDMTALKSTLKHAKYVLGTMAGVFFAAGGSGG